MQEVKAHKELETCLRECKVCHVNKIRVQDGTFDGVNKRWIDDKGKQWSGKTCPDCHRERTAVNMKQLRKYTHVA